MSSQTSSLAHVFLVDQGIDLSHETVDRLAYDDANGLLMAVKGGHVFAYEVAAGGPHNLRWTYPLQEGPSVLGLRCSLDGKLLAVQRSSTLVEFVDLETGNIFVHSAHRGKGDILGFFFSESPETDFVLVTTRGVEMHQFVAKRQGLRCREQAHLSLTWQLYTHETRLLLVGCGPHGSRMQAWQFTAQSVVKLPLFELKPAPLPGEALAAIGLEQLRLLKVYGRVYLAYIDREAMKLQLFRFYTDMVTLQHSYELFTPAVELSVTDNVIVVTHTDAAVAMLLDVCAEGELPVANPLPLAVLLQHEGEAAQAACHLSPAPSMGAARAAEQHYSGPTHEPAVPQPGWQFLTPGLVLVLEEDGPARRRALYRLALDLRALAESCSDWPLLVGFMQRRRPCPVASLRVMPKTLLISIIKLALQERLPMPVLHRIFDHINRGYADSLQRAAAASTSCAIAAGGGGGPFGGGSSAVNLRAASVLGGGTAQVVTPQEVAQDVFRWAHDEEVVDAPYLQAALTEYQASADAADIVLPPYIQMLSVDVLLQQGQQHQVLQLLSRQPGISAALLAERPRAAATDAATASAAGDAGDGWQAPPVSQLLLDLQARRAVQDCKLGMGVGAMGSYVRELLARGEIVKAARLTQEHGLQHVAAPEQWLAACAAAGQLHAFMAVYRLWLPELQTGLPSLEDAKTRYFAAANQQGAPR